MQSFDFCHKFNVYSVASILYCFPKDSDVEQCKEVCLKVISCLFTFSCVEVNIFFQLRRLLEGQDAMDFRQFDTKIQVEFQIGLLLCKLNVGANFAMDGSFKPSCWQ